MTPAPPGKRTRGTAELTVTLLESRHRPSLQVPRPFESGIMMQLREPTVPFYRFLLDQVGRGRMWPERRAMTDEEIGGILGSEQVSVTVLSIGGVPAGFFELDRREDGIIVLARVGLVPEFTGRGFGRYLLAAAVEAAWDEDPEVVRAETTDRHDPRSLLLFQWAGFEPVGTTVRKVPV